MCDETTPVLIVGGGLVGLSASLFLSWHGVDSVLVERRSGTSIHPRAWGWYPRTLELLRTVGIEGDVLRESAGFVGHTLNCKVESLTGKEIFRTEIPDPEDVSDISPVQRIVSLSQDRLEPIVLRRAGELGGDLRFGRTLVRLTPDADGVTAVVRDGDTREERTIRAQYVIAADGAHSRIREQLGIERHGRGTLRHQISILFRAALEGPLNGRRFAICQVDNPEVEGILGHDDSLEQGTLIVTYHPEQGESAEDFTEARCVQLVRAAIGLPELEVGIRSVLPWEMAALTAERFAEGRVFLAGDAAHVIPPVGGYGANTGIQDAHNLAWKLAAVLAGTAGPGLLDTYDTERRPVAMFTMEQAGLRLAVRAGFATEQQKAATADTLTVTFGYRYSSDAIASEQAPGVPAVHPRELTGQPGTRAPHLAARRSGTPISLLDLFGSRPVLLVGGQSAQWGDAARLVAKRLGVDLDVYQAGTDFEAEGEWHEAFGVSAAGAVLVRPDGFVCWRSAVEQDAPEPVLEEALNRMLSRS
ncbi:FAD-dependent monooxygenase [Amycolatopsis nigrescens]|uniref:FAD-dependent monooxygenase n=1 Tax=Amycolatopsis nigrescens TaxID=381445 RepID=UPI00036317F3|nr:FAD-dependent monooxygenase [Amycolatopsis nigrescens]